MSDRLYSVEQVADLLGLHVKTVRGYVRDGRLNAARIGRQYRIAQQDLEALTGRPVASARDTARRHRHVEVSGVVQIDAIDREAMSRISNTLIAGVKRPDDDGRHLRVETIYDEERASMKIVLIGGLDDVASMLKIIQVTMEDRP